MTTGPVTTGGAGGAGGGAVSRAAGAVGAVGTGGAPAKAAPKAAAPAAAAKSARGRSAQAAAARSRSAQRQALSPQPAQSQSQVQATAQSQAPKGQTARSHPGQPPTEQLQPNQPPTDPRRGYWLRHKISLLSLRSRVSLLVMIVVGFTVALVSVISYMTISRQITNNLDNTLFKQARSIAQTNLASPTGPTDPYGMDSTNATTILNIAGLQGALVDGQGGAYLPVPASMENGRSQPVSAIAPTNLTTDVQVAEGTLPSAVRTVVEPNGTSYRVVSVPVASRELYLAPDSPPQVTPPYALVLATSLSNTQSTLHLLSLILFLVGLLGIALAGAAGLAVAKTALRPVHRLTVAAEYIAKTGDLRRIQVTGEDELARLTTSFNTMLEALARSHDHQRRLVADAGHELRTPLTSMRTNLDLLSQAITQAEQEPDRPRLSAQDRAELMSDVRAQMEELSLLISDLVELSRDEHPSHSVEDLDLADVVERAIERVQRRAPDLHYDCRLEPWYLKGEPAALERAVTNLLDNAAKWSPPRGTVTVRLVGGALEVADQGPGIDEADLAHVFERFYRSPEARTMPGSGLGLAIVRQVAENHGGRVAAARAPGTAGKPGGALLGVWLPGSAQPPR